MSLGVSTAILLQGFVSQSRAAATAPVQLAAEVIVIGIGASVAAGLVALGYRWYVRERVPTGLAVLFGLSVVAVSLVPTGALGPVIRGDEAVLGSEYVLRNLAAFALGAVGSSVGIRVGDAVGTDLFAATGGIKVDRDVSEVVQTVGRVTSVKLPEDIDDIVGYDPMPDETKEALSGRHFLFPRRLTKADLRERLVSRMKTDYGVGHIDLELRDDGTVEYLAIGSRAAGIGPTLPPATNAIAIRADPAHAASAGDLVQVWDTDPLSRVLTGELRGVAGDVVTVAIDAGDTPKLDPTKEYKLVTLPVQDRPDREFASLLRAAEETMGTVTVPENSELVGTTVGELGVTVAAITREGAAPEPIPSRERVLTAGDVVYVIAKPEALRQFEGAASRQREPEVTPASDESDEEPTAVPDDSETTADTASDESADTAVPASADDSDHPTDEDETDEATAGDQSTEESAQIDGETDHAAEQDADSDDSQPDDTQSDRDRVSETPTDEDATNEQATDGDVTDGDEPSDTPAEAETGEGNGDRRPDDGTAEPPDPAASEESVTVWDPEERLDEDESVERDDEATGRDDENKAERDGDTDAAERDEHR